MLTSFMMAITTVCYQRIYIVQNEGGFSKSITGQLVLEGINSGNAVLQRRKLNFKTAAKGLNFFESGHGD